MDVKLLNSLKSCWVVLQFLGLVYNEDDRAAKRYRRRIIGCCLMMVLAIPLEISLLYATTKANNFIQLAENFGLFCFVLFSVVKSWNVIIRCERLMKIQQNIAEIVKRVSKDERHKDLEHLKLRLKFATKHYEKFKITTICTGLIMLILTIVYGKFPIDIFKGLYDDNSTEAYVSSVYSSISCIHGVLTVTSINMLPIIMFSFGIGFNDELAARLKQVGISKEFDYKELKECIEIHQMIKNFVSEIKDCFRPMFYLHNIFSQLIICMFAFNLVNTKSLDELALSIAFATISFFEILINCHFGSELEKSSKNLLDAIYQSDWLNCELKTKKLMVTFMENLKQPMKINCYLIFNINLEQFAKIMNGAYSFYCVLVELAG